jgi:hypothetical protein
MHSRSSRTTESDSPRFGRTVTVCSIHAWATNHERTATLDVAVLSFPTIFPNAPGRIPAPIPRFLLQDFFGCGSIREDNWGGAEGSARRSHTAEKLAIKMGEEMLPDDKGFGCPYCAPKEGKGHWLGPKDRRCGGYCIETDPRWFRK